MQFNSLIFALFFPLVFGIYWLVTQSKQSSTSQIRIQNVLLILASYVFYGWWDWRFLGLIALSSLVDFYCAQTIHESKGKARKSWLAVSIITNIGLLGFFKYFNFFADSFAELLTGLGLEAHPSSLQIILPVGISFYTFQTLSYTIDVYRNELKPTKDPFAFFAFVSFFPQLVAGPIERGKQFLPQFIAPRKFDVVRAKDGLRQILWGLFKKIVIADTCAILANDIFAAYDTIPGGTLLLGMIFFSFQIYADFSGYSDIAIGTARLLGFDLMQNFATPYLSRSPGEFWRRWHISLSTWFRDYVYIPLGGSRGSKPKQLRNLIITFTVSGFWHGANWTYVIWGLINGLLYIPQVLLGMRSGNQIVAEKRWWPHPFELLKIAVTFFVIGLTWIFFRSETVGDALAYLHRMFTVEQLNFSSETNFSVGLWWIALLLLIEWFQRRKPHGLDIPKFPFPLRWATYILFILVILVFGQFGYQEFIYFQF